jgi:trans-aconitate methyltransferase
VSWFEADPRLSRDLVARTGAARGSPIIDVGGGLSALARRLAEDGYSDLTVLDVSAEAVRRAVGEAGPAGTAIRGVVADVTTWRPDRRYAVWHDRAVLHFLVGDAERNAYRRTLEQALAPGGQAVIATFAPSGPDRCSGLAVRRYGGPDLRAFLGDGFEVLESFEFDHRTPAGAVQRFHVGRAARR